MEQQKISYLPNYKTEFIKELKDEVAQYFKTHNLSKFGNGKIVFKTVFMFSLYFVPYLLMVGGIIESWMGVYACWILMGLGKAGVGMGVMHDANHRTYSKNQKVNKWMGKSLYLLGGFPPNWQRQHNTNHHGFTNIDGKDEDIEPAAILRFSPHKPLKKIHRYQHFYAWFLYGLMTILWITTKDFKQLIRYKKEGLPLSHKQSYTKLFTYMILGKILYYVVFLVIPLLTLPVAWYWVVMFFLTMHFISGFILGTVFQTAHVVPTSEFPVPNESGTIENSFAIHQLYNTSDFAPRNRALSWFIGGLNYQVEHHLFPGISHVHYHKIAAIVKEKAEKYELPYYVQPGFLKAVWEHARMLKQLGRA
jgi:linoleoyl-CoA desaturase